MILGMCPGDERAKDCEDKMVMEDETKGKKY